jgi:hypothetical protein
MVGNGPLDFVFVPGYISNLEVHWEEPGFGYLMRRLGAFTRLIMFDKTRHRTERSRRCPPPAHAGDPHRTMCGR